MSRLLERPNARTIEVGSIPIEVAGSGTGPPLVYLHGAFGYLGWPQFLDQLSERFTVYAPHHPGFGESGDADALEDLLDVTLFHLDLLDRLGLERVHLVGSFFGAMIAAEVAAVAGHRIDRLVLATPMGLWLEDHPGVDYFAATPGSLRKILFADPESDAACRWLPEPESDEQRQLDTIERTRSLATVAKFMWPIPDKGLKKRLPRIRRPTQIIVAEKDRLVAPAYGSAFAELIGGSQIAELAGAGHLCQLENPGEFASLVNEFLAD